MRSRETPLTEEEALALIGDPDEHARQVDGFSRSVQRFWDRHDELLQAHPDSWVAVHGDHILVAKSSDVLFEEMDRAGIPRDQSFVRFLAAKQRLLIL